MKVQGIPYKNLTAAVPSNAPLYYFIKKKHVIFVHKVRANPRMCC